MNVLGIVGARSGSKGLPGKNLRPLLGKPLLGWAIAPELEVRVCPTAPLIRPADIDRAFEIVRDDPEAHSAILMTPAREHPRKVVKIALDTTHAISYITERGSHGAPTNRQSYEEACNRQSLPIVRRRRTILELGSQTGEIVRFHVVPQETTFDIDTDLDFRIVEKLLLERKQGAADGS